MSLQVSNQTTGRRTPQTYQGFGGNGPAGAAAGGGGTAANGAGGNVARATKGGTKQSQIPVAVAVTNEAASTAVTPTALVHPGMGGVAMSFAAQKLQQQQQPPPQQFDHQYVAEKQQAEAVNNNASVGKEALSLGQSTGRKTTNGNSTNGAGNVSSATEKNGSPTKKGDLEGSIPLAKAEHKASTANNAGSVPSSEGGKMRDSPRSSGRTAQQQKPSDEVLQKTPEQPKEKPTGGNKAAQKGTIGSMESSLVIEKPLKGFDTDGEEMPSLLLEPWDHEDSPMPPQAKSKLAKSGIAANARAASFKAFGNSGKPDGQLSTVLEQTTPAEEKPSKATEAPATPPRGGSDTNVGRPLRSISGRRSMRPITDIKFTYPRKSTELNDSISSLNATAGSDTYMDSLATPGSASRKRKDMTSESESAREAVDSPKRARLDFSGFLGMVASPMTMLKNRLSRVKLHSSTPRSLAVEEEDASKVVPAETFATTVNVVGPATDDAAKMEIDIATEAKEGKGSQSATGDGAAEHTEKDPSAATSPQSADSEEDVVVKIVTDKQKQWCTVM